MDKESTINPSSVKIVAEKAAQLSGFACEVNWRVCGPYVIEEAVARSVALYFNLLGYPDRPDLSLDGPVVLVDLGDLEMRVYSLGCGILWIRPVRTHADRLHVRNSSEAQLDAIFVELPEVLQDEILVDIQIKLSAATLQGLTPQECHPVAT